MSSGSPEPSSAGASSSVPGSISRARRLIGIDLGTTNSALAWVDLEARGARTVQPFAIEQLVAAAEVAPWPVLPSFLYFPTEAERASGRFAVPWDPVPESIVGVLARDHGVLVPARQVTSAKSWLSNPMVDRTAALLPWIAEGSAPKISPVTAAARYLTHLREAWNHTYACADATLRFEHQAIVLTVPASFDEEARELTVEAARAAGCTQLTLLEEPLAALYAFLAAHGTPGSSAVSLDTLAAGQLVLVCDVGGGTTDFSLIRATQVAGELSFERVAIGEHLLLGGDNVDLALAALVEQRLTQTNGNAPRLSLAQQQTLRRQCSAAKEQLLGESPPGAVTITVLGSGRGLIGGALHAVLTRTEVVSAIESFLPLCARDDAPRRDRRLGLRELGLPYESEPAITRHLAAFLRRAAQIREPAATASEAQEMAQPSAVLFNGGFFAPAIAREHILGALTAWFGKPPLELENQRPEAAVAVGAAFYARLLHDPTAARRLLIRAGSARAYYIGVEATEPQAGITAVCIMPRGTQEGTDLTLAREFSVVTNQPVAFTLYSSTQRTDALDAVVQFESSGDVHRHAPLATTLRFGKRSGRIPIGVRLAVRYTELGTLELVCEAQATEHRWQLQFNLRPTEQSTSAPSETTPVTQPPPPINVSEAVLAAAETQLRQVFDPSLVTRAAPDSLVKDLEATLGMGKGRWPLAVIRRLADALLASVAGRALSARHEARWLNLMGFCARPGFGTSSDAWRITELRKVYAAELAFPKDVQCQVEWLVLWQRVAAGFNAAQQRDLVQRLSSQLGLNVRKPPHLNAQIARESWRLLGSLERLEAGMRVRLGDEVLARALREPQNNAYLWALGRFGARVPIYGPLNTVVSAAMAERWLDALLGFESLSGEAVATIVQIGARTDDPARDIGETMRQRALERLAASAVSEERLRALQEVVQIDSRDLVRAFGESLPEGLRLVS